MKRCIFCKSELTAGNRTKEHILPRWLIDEWGLSQQAITPTHFGEDGQVLSSRLHNVGSMISGHICAVCNNGWMSQLEDCCKPLILELAAGKRRIVDISDADALLLARWTVKTAYALHVASNYRSIVPESHFSVLDKTEYRLPPGVYVVGHTYKSGKNFSWCQTTTWSGIFAEDEASAEDIQTLAKYGYKIAIKLGGLFLMVFFNPLSNARETLWYGRHIPIYPRWSHPVVWMRQERAWPSKDLVRFFAFVHMLGVTFGHDMPGSALARGEVVSIGGPIEYRDSSGNPRARPMGLHSDGDRK